MACLSLALLASFSHPAWSAAGLSDYETWADKGLAAEKYRSFLRQSVISSFLWTRPPREITWQAVSTTGFHCSAWRCGGSPSLVARTVIGDAVIGDLPPS
jgi:hypothetical protein